jgi:predicted ATPase
VEAVAHLTRALELLNTLPDTLVRARQELTLQIALGALLVATKGIAAPEVENAYTRARELCQRTGETSQLFPVLQGLCELYGERGEYQTALELGEQLLTLARRQPDPALLLIAHQVLADHLFWLGEFTTAREHLEQGIALHDAQQHRTLAFRYGYDPGVICRLFAAIVLWAFGYPDQALKEIHTALSLARELAHLYTVVCVLHFASRLHQLRREAPAAQERAEMEIALCTEQGFAFFLAGGSMYRGWALVEQGQGEEGIVQIRQGLTAYRATGAEMAVPYFLALLAEAYGQVGEAEQGLAALGEALAQVKQTGERWYEAELYRLKGTLMFQSQASFRRVSDKSRTSQDKSENTNLQAVEQEAEEYFLKAIDLARQQRAKSLELRATVSLARLWQQQGKTKQAHNVLLDIYGWFTEGFDTKDLQEAKTLLEELT